MSTLVEKGAALSKCLTNNYIDLWSQPVVNRFFILCSLRLVVKGVDLRIVTARFLAFFLSVRPKISPS